MNKTENKIIMVPHDFSDASNQALEFSAYLAKKMKYNLGILNIQDSGTLSYFKNHGLNISKDISNRYFIETTYLIKPKAPIKQIGKIAYENDAVFLGIGLEKPKAGASRIMQLIAKSPVPVFVVYDRQFMPITDIVFPLDDTEESRQKTGWAAHVALATDATIHIYSINLESQSENIVYAHNIIIKQVEKYFSEKWIKYKTVYAPDEKNSFGSHYVKYAESIDAGLIIIMRESRSFLSSIIWDPNDKAVFYNSKKIPALIVNPKNYAAR